MSGLEEADHHHPHAPPEHPTRDADGIPDSQDSGAGGGQAPRQQAQEEQRLGSRSQSPHGHRQTFVQIGCPKRMELCRGGLRARSGLPETSRRSWPLLVHLPAMRGKMGTIGNFAIKLLDFFGGRTSQGQAQQTSLPERSATTKVGPSRAESGDQGEGQRPVADCATRSSPQEPECTNGTPSWTSDGHSASMVTARPSRSAEEMSGLIALQSLRSQGQIPSPERYQLNMGEMSPTGIVSPNGRML